MTEFIMCALGIVHHTRRKAGKKNAVVYGVLTDGDVFHFLRIDNDSNVRK